MSETFDAYVLEGPGPAVLRQLSEQDLPDAEVTVDVSHSSLNYTDGLAMTGKARSPVGSPWCAASTWPAPWPNPGRRTGAPGTE
jgi:NADPH:quinone reductase-like Zn-dependent oxidoreductase